MDGAIIAASRLPPTIRTDPWIGHTSRFAKRWKSSMEAPTEQISAGAEFCPGGENARRAIDSRAEIW